jgi:hypothetical protein
MYGCRTAPVRVYHGAGIPVPLAMLLVTQAKRRGPCEIRAAGTGERTPAVPQAQTAVGGAMAASLARDLARLLCI